MTNDFLTSQQTNHYAAHVILPHDVQKTTKDLVKYKDPSDLMRDKKGNLILDIKMGHGETSVRFAQSYERKEQGAGQPTRGIEEKNPAVKGSGPPGSADEPRIPGGP